MVTTEHGSSEADYRFVIRPNCSLSGACALLVFLAVCAVSALVALRFYLIGVWVVLPLAAAEMAVLGIAMYLVLKATRRRQIISVNHERVEIVHLDSNKSARWRFPPYWAQMVLLRDPKQWYPSSLWIRSHGQEVEIGSFLIDSERERLAADLRLALGACGARRYA